MDISIYLSIKYVCVTISWPVDMWKPGKDSIYLCQNSIIEQTSNECIQTELFPLPHGSQSSPVLNRCDAAVCCSPPSSWPTTLAPSLAKAYLPRPFPRPHLCVGVSMNTHSPSLAQEKKNVDEMRTSSGHLAFQSFPIPSVSLPCVVATRIWPQN